MILLFWHSSIKQSRLKCGTRNKINYGEKNLTLHLRINLLFLNDIKRAIKLCFMKGNFLFFFSFFVAKNQHVFLFVLSPRAHTRGNKHVLYSFATYESERKYFFNFIYKGDSKSTVMNAVLLMTVWMCIKVLEVK